MNIVYETDQIKLIHGDCLEVIPMLEDTIDAVITDPPYGINHPCNFESLGRSKLSKCNDWNNVYNDNNPFDPSHLLHYPKIVLWGANHYANKLPLSSGWLVWDKKRPSNLDQATCELAWTNCIKGVRIFHHLWHGMMRESEHGEAYHPTQKPVALFKWILNLRWLKDVGVILDPYCGSGPLLLAALETNRKVIGVEIEEQYINTTIKRLNRWYEQHKLLYSLSEKTKKQTVLFGNNDA